MAASDRSSLRGIIDDLRRGDESAARRIWLAYYGQLLGVARRELPPAVRRREDEEDVVQSAFRSFFHRMADGEYSLQDIASLERLLTTITRNKALDRRRRHLGPTRNAHREVHPHRDSAMVSDRLQEASDHAATPEQELAFQESLDLLLGQLDSLEKDIVLLKMSGYSNAEIGRAVNRSERTVERKLHSIRAKWENR